MRRVYADWAAGALLRPAARAALEEALAAGGGNPSSPHWAGVLARTRLEAARERIATAIHADPLEIVFTSGATEANNLTLGGVASAAGHALAIAVAASDHASVLEPARALAAAGHRVTVLPVSAAGAVDAGAIEQAAPDLVSLTLVNAETGVVQELAPLVAAARASGARVHLDAAQAAGLVPLDVEVLGVDLLTLSGHKVGGPPGSGALWVRRGSSIAPILRGGPHEGGRRAGTENVPASVAFAVALTTAVAERTHEAPRLAALSARLRHGLARCPGARFPVPDGVATAGHIVNVAFSGLAADSLVTALDLEGVAVSAGSACAAGASEPSHVLRAMGWPAAEARSALRVSLGWASTDADVDRILTVVPEVVRRARARYGAAA